MSKKRCSQQEANELSSRMEGKDQFDELVPADSQKYERILEFKRALGV
jgi:hypothetical protein